MSLIARQCTFTVTNLRQFVFSHCFNFAPVAVTNDKNFMTTSGRNYTRSIMSPL